MAGSAPRTVQLDKNAGSKKLRDTCNEDGVVDCSLLPRNIRDADDDVVLEHGISSGRLTLTFDRTMFEDNPQVLAGKSPGMILLRMDSDSTRRISRKTATKLLREFKESFPIWHEVPWQHSFIELTPTLLFVYETITNAPRQVALLERKSLGWQDQLKSILENNAAGILSE